MEEKTYQKASSFPQEDSSKTPEASKECSKEKVLLCVPKECLEKSTKPFQQSDWKVTRASDIEGVWSVFSRSSGTGGLCKKCGLSITGCPCSKARFIESLKLSQLEQFMRTGKVDFLWSSHKYL